MKQWRSKLPGQARQLKKEHISHKLKSRARCMRDSFPLQLSSPTERGDFTQSDDTWEECRTDSSIQFKIKGRNRLGNRTEYPANNPANSREDSGDTVGSTHCKALQSCEKASRSNIILIEAVLEPAYWCVSTWVPYNVRPHVRV